MTLFNIGMLRRFLSSRGFRRDVVTFFQREREEEGVLEFVRINSACC